MIICDYLSKRDFICFMLNILTRENYFKRDFIYKDIKITVVPFKSKSQRITELYNARKLHNRCTQCNEKTDFNINVNQYYKKCLKHRLCENKLKKARYYQVKERLQ